MSQCKRDGCSKPAKGRGSYCSGACRVAHHRASVTSNDPKLPSVTIQSVTDVTIMGKCYNRPAIPCSEFSTRPAPRDVTDTPKPKNRGKYVRADGSEYQFDFCGMVFECPHEAFDDQDRRRTEVYTMQELKKSQEAA